MPIVEIKRDMRTHAQKVSGDVGEELYELDGYWCLTADKSRAVIEGHPDGRFVLGGPGSRIPMSEARRLGLVGSPEPPPPESPPEPSSPAPKPKKSKPSEV